MFVSIFGRCINAKENFLSLYNAIHDTNLKIGEVKITPMMLDNMVYTGLYNDVSMLIDDKFIVLAEQQSTINNNMPLRCLEYVTRLFEKMYTHDRKYNKALIKLPTPEFYVFYNGREDYPAEQELKLSDAFKEPNSDIQLDLKVKVFNINHSKSHDILNKCKSLSDYSTFVKYAMEGQINKDPNFIRTAIDRCIKENVMIEYLQSLSQEDRNMIFGEYDYETDIRVQREESFEAGANKKAVEAAIALLKEGDSVEKVSRCINLPLEQVQKLAEEIKG